MSVFCCFYYLNITLLCNWFEQKPLPESTDFESLSCQETKLSQLALNRHPAQTTSQPSSILGCHQALVSVRPSIGCAIYLIPPAWPSGFSRQPDCFLAVCVQRKIASEKLWRQRRPTHGKNANKENVRWCLERAKCFGKEEGYHF